MYVFYLTAHMSYDHSTTACEFSVFFFFMVWFRIFLFVFFVVIAVVVPFSASELMGLIFK